MEELTQKELYFYLDHLTKSELGKELELHDMEIRKVKKHQLVQQLFEKVSGNEVLIKRIMTDYAKYFSLHPIKVEEILKITKTERLRWTKNNKLQVMYYDSLHKWGSTYKVPMYNGLEITKMTTELIEKWRVEDKTKAQENRRKAAEKAIEKRNKNKKIKNDFYNKEWKQLLVSWFKIDPKLGATLQVAFWTVWISR